MSSTSNNTGEKIIFSLLNFDRKLYVPVVTYLIDPIFSEVNIFFALSIQNKNKRTSHTGYFFEECKPNIAILWLINKNNFGWAC